MAKSIIDFLETLFEYYFLNIILNVIVNVSHLKFKRYCQYYPEILYKSGLNKELKLMEGAMKYFLKNYWAMNYLGLWSPGAANFFFSLVKI